MKQLLEGWRGIARLAIAGLLAAWVLAALLPITFAGIDARFAAAWGEEILLFQGPGFDGAVPAKHPFTLALGALATPLGVNATLDLFIGVSLLALAGVGWAAWRLGNLLGGAEAGWAVALIVLTRPEVIDQAISAGKDLPFVAMLLVALVLVLEHRTERWLPILGVLAVAGLIRPEAWILAAGFAIWALNQGEREPGERRLILGLAASAPLIWISADLILTGDLLHTYHQLRDKPEIRAAGDGAANAASMVEDSRLSEVGSALGKGFPGIIGWPLVVAGALASVAAWRQLGGENPDAGPGGRARTAMLARSIAISILVAGILIVVIGATTVGLPIDDRFLLPVALLTACLLASAFLLRQESQLALAALAIGLIGTLAGLPGAISDIGDDMSRNDDLNARTNSLLALASDPATEAALAECPVIYLGGSPRAQVQIGRTTLALALEDDLDALVLRRGRILTSDPPPGAAADAPPLNSAFGFRVAGKGLTPQPARLLQTASQAGEWRFASLC